MDPIAHHLVIREPKFPERRDGAEGRGLRTEVCATEEEHVDGIANPLMDAVKDREPNFDLTRNHLVDVVATAARGNIPLRHIADTARILESRGRNQPNVSQCGAAKRGEKGKFPRIGGANILINRVQLCLGYGLKFFQIVSRVQMIGIKMILPDYGIEEVETLRHAARRTSREIPLRIDQSVSIIGHRYIELTGHQYFQPIQRPRLPVLVLKAEQRLASEESLDVDAKLLLQIILDFAKHLERIKHLYGMLVQTEVVTQLRNAANVDSGGHAPAKVHGNVIRLAMIQRVHHAFTRCAYGTCRRHTYPFNKVTWSLVANRKPQCTHHYHGAAP